MLSVESDYDYDYDYDTDYDTDSKTDSNYYKSKVKIIREILIVNFSIHFNSGDLIFYLCLLNYLIKSQLQIIDISRVTSEFQQRLDDNYLVAS